MDGVRIMEGLIGKKLGMTQIFNEDGQCIPVTVIKLGPCYVLQKKTVDKEGYNSLRLGFDETKENKLNKPRRGLYKKVKTPPLKIEREFRIGDEKLSVHNVGDSINVADIFKENDFIDVSGTSKGKGFQGVVKRYGFKGGPKTHGSKFHRVPGAIGQCADPSRTFPGTKLPGRMGGRRVTIQNLLVAKVDKENSLLLIKGALPGRKGSYIIVKKSIKKSINDSVKTI